MRSSYLFWINRGTLFGRIILNENANNNAYRAVPQDAHDFGRPEGVRGFSRILGRIKSLSRQVSEKGLFQVFLCFSFGSSMGCLLSIIYLYTFKYGSPDSPEGLLFSPAEW